MPQSPVFWIVVYAIGLIGTTFFFQWQRVALAVVRNASVPEEYRGALVPGWFRVAWIPRILGWIGIAGLYVPFGIWGVVVGGLLFFLAPSFLPLAHPLFLPLCRRYWKQKRQELEAVASPQTAEAIDQALQDAERNLHVWS